ncbi:MAG: carboxypeptidase-like regulatory domain-containing protein [Bacteroidales bacterium]|nr:carboxypeptidase-like regulatory domain-containing protein [Bacteroidales bacterium]
MNQTYCNFFFLLWLIILPTVSCNDISDNQTKIDFYQFTKNKIISPSKTKSIDIYENRQSESDAMTQIIVNFGYPDSKGGGGIFAANGIDLNIEVIWLHDNDVMIKYPETTDIIKQDSIIHFINDFVYVYYTPIKLRDSLKSKVLAYDLIGKTDTITAILKGQIIDFNLNKPISNKRISISSGLVMYDNITDSEGFFEFNMIPAGNYRLIIKHEGYLDLIMDTIFLDTGDIRLLNIGMISNNKLDTIKKSIN